jgi:putative colanic acid biosysnthesis UDP-glucose lipid carrier transferase
VTIRQGRYSKFLRPISYIIDLTLINGLGYWLFFKEDNGMNFFLFASISWIVISAISPFYEVYRFTRLTVIFTKIVRQLVVFSLVVLSISALWEFDKMTPTRIGQYVLVLFVCVSLAKYFIYFALQRYRSDFGGNFRRTIVIGSNGNVINLEHFFKENPEYGYKLHGTMTFQGPNAISVEECCRFILEHKIDEIYCSEKELNPDQLNALIDFADNNLKIIKFLPDEKRLSSQSLTRDYYDYIPVVSLRHMPLEIPFNRQIKRGFDILFSLLVMVLLLSWLIPVIGILIKLETKGPILFRQRRNGFNNHEFICYKFRSMILNEEADLIQVTKGDERVTRVGRLLRRSSVDELPQFINVFFGEMSVVGPRPHMVSHSQMYANSVDKFMVRHFVKPGITGLAQIKGFRGEVESADDIINRVKYDIFYIENWSPLLDFKIILQTMYNFIRGDKKAY